MRKKKLSYDTYVKEREMLSKMESTNYENYEKTMMTLAASFLAFSVSFLGLFKSSNGSQVLVNQKFLTFSWILFAVSVVSILVGFLVGALALRAEVKLIEDALEDIKALDGKNYWTLAQYILYIAAGLSFIAGICFLILFCSMNIGLLVK
jgi:hypothetical protein